MNDLGYKEKYIKNNIFLLKNEKIKKNFNNPNLSNLAIK